MWLLPLGDARWHTLTTNSPAKEFLPLLNELETNPTSANRIVRAFHDEWYVYQDFTVYETTVAVVPYFVHAASRLPASERSGILEFVGFYANLVGVPISDGRDWVQPDPDIRDGYAKAVQIASTLMGEVLALPPFDESTTIERLATMAAFRGDSRVACLLFGLSFLGHSCPECDCDLDLLKRWGGPF